MAAALAVPIVATAAQPLNPVPAVAKIQAEIAAAQKREQRLEHSPAVKILNPYYIRIATAVVTHGQAALARYAAAMQKFSADSTRPYLRFPATRAEVFCLARLTGEKDLVRAYGQLCRVGRRTLFGKRVVKFTDVIFPWLEKHKRSAWVDAAVAQGLSDCGAGPGTLYIMLFNWHLATMQSPVRKAKAIEAAIARALPAVAKAKKFSHTQVRDKAHPGGAMVLGFPARLKIYQHGLETLRYELVVNAADGLSATELCQAARSYLGIYGAHGRYSATVFYTVLSNLLLAQRDTPGGAAKRQIISDGRWLGAWYPRIVKEGGPLTNKIKLLWHKWKRIAT